MNKKEELKKLIADQEKDAAKHPIAKVVDPADKAKRTKSQKFINLDAPSNFMYQSKLYGRSTLAQQDCLEKLGVSREKSVAMTKYAASGLINSLLTKRKGGR